MKIDFDVPMRFKEKPVEGKTVEDAMWEILANYGGLTGQLKAGVSNILGKIANSEDEVELNQQEIQNLKRAWNQACEDENFRIPLMYDEAISNFLNDLEG